MNKSISIMLGIFFGSLIFPLFVGGNVLFSATAIASSLYLIVILFYGILNRIREPK